MTSKQLQNYCRKAQPSLTDQIMCKRISSLISLLSQQRQGGEKGGKNARKVTRKIVLARNLAHTNKVLPPRAKISTFFHALHSTFQMSSKLKASHQKKLLNLIEPSAEPRGTQLLGGSSWWSWECWRTHMANLSVLALSPHLSPAASSLAKRDRSLPANASRGKMGEKQRSGVT